MAEKPNDPQQAMNRVLQAERDAEAAVADCENQAREVIHDARQRAQRIANRADERISMMKTRSSQQVAGEIKRREREQKTALQQQAPELDESGLAECITDIAAVLTGGSG